MNVFVYGTLTDPDRVARVVPFFEFRGPATLDGLHRVDGEYPTLAPGGSVDGRVLRTPDVEALDAYEGVESGLYVRASVPWMAEGAETSERESADADEHENADADEHESADADERESAEMDGSESPETNEREDDRRAGGEGGHGAGRGSVDVYVGDPDALGADATWPGEGPFPERVRRFVREKGVAVRSTRR